MKKDLKKEKQKIVVSVQNAYYKTNRTFCNVTEESLFKLDPVAETKVFVTLEKNDNFDSNVEDVLTYDYIPSDVEKECDVLYTIMCFDGEMVYKSIQKVDM